MCEKWVDNFTCLWVFLEFSEEETKKIKVSMNREKNESEMLSLIPEPTVEEGVVWYYSKISLFIHW